MLSQPSRLFPYAVYTKQNVMFALLLMVTLAIEILAVSTLTHSGSLPDLDRAESFSSDSVGVQTIIHAPQELSSHGKGDTLQRDQDQVRATLNSLQSKTLSELRKNDLKLFFFDGPSGTQQMQRLKDTQEVIDSMSRGKSSLAYIKVGHFGNQHNDEETEYRLHALRGRLSDIFDKRKTNPDDYVWSQHVSSRLGPNPNAQKIWNDIMKSELETWQEQTFRQSLRRIRIELQKRQPTRQERAILQLEKIQAAGFSITKKEQQLAEKLSKFSRVASSMNSPVDKRLSTNEDKLLKEISRRTIAVRRNEQASELVRKLKNTPKGVELFRDSPQDLELIASALKELASKEQEGKVWTPTETYFLAALKIESKGLGKKKSNLDQILAALKKQKAYDVLHEARAHIHENVEEALKMEKLEAKLIARSKVTDEDIAEVAKLAKQYYRLKKLADTPLHLDVIRVARNEALSQEERAIRLLEDTKAHTELHESQAKLLHKLKQGSPLVDIPEEGKKWVRHLVKSLTTHSPIQLDKAQEFEKALHGTQEWMSIQHAHKSTKARFYDEVVRSRPAIEWWIEKSSKSSPAPKDYEKHLTFTERCQVLVLSKVFRPNQYLPSLEDLALERLEALSKLRHLTIQEGKLCIRLRDPEKGSEMINTPDAKKMIQNLATEANVVRICKPTPEDQKLVLRLAQNVNIGFLPDNAWQKLHYLFRMNSKNSAI
ncbi:hypothetical protein PTTG_27884 [Puccinia triticina 1-1 BBBD Race 1]|uniref:Uncharacterized protein n=1 Tax=Puccinia triticina (isolate 1-1 / race 1 (BBBD)) TaxID=630390 RepID=A0A180GGJ0_PUCT1|nr:hypothetical protein PTTG_27884 [Puccinia triticina 1-1 BBBD Race 1]